MNRRSIIKAIPALFSLPLLGKIVKASKPPGFTQEIFSVCLDYRSNGGISLIRHTKEFSGNTTTDLGCVVEYQGTLVKRLEGNGWLDSKGNHIEWGGDVLFRLNGKAPVPNPLADYSNARAPVG